MHRFDSLRRLQFRKPLPHVDALSLCRRRKRDRLKSFLWGRHGPSTASSDTTKTTTETVKEFSDSYFTKSLSESTYRSATLDPYAIDPYSVPTMRQTGFERVPENVKQYQESALRNCTSGGGTYRGIYMHPYAIEPPPAGLSPEKHAKWERKEMTKHAASRLSLKTTSRPLVPCTSAGSTLSSEGSEENGKENEKIAGFSGFFKSVRSFFGSKEAVCGTNAATAEPTKAYVSPDDISDFIYSPGPYMPSQLFESFAVDENKF